MSNSTYEARRDVFFRMKTEVERLLSHPELEAPDHPYVDTLREMAEYATLGVIDTSNGMLYDNDSTVFDGAVIFVPVLEADLKKTDKVRLSSSLCKQWDTEQVYDLAVLKKASGVCDAWEGIVSPIISVAPHMNDRPPLSFGITAVHELDHAHWWWKRKRLHKHGTAFDEIGVAEQEISAARLEQQLYFAHAPELYDQEYGRVSLIYGSLDFSKVYKPRDNDKERKAARVVAFLNFMFDELGADVGVRPNDDVMAAMRAQEVI